ncbi:MAG TPA: hypothetical protein VIK74_06380 [Parasegetibacter sp.]
MNQENNPTNAGRGSKENENVKLDPMKENKGYKEKNPATGDTSVPQKDQGQITNQDEKITNADAEVAKAGPDDRLEDVDENSKSIQSDQRGNDPEIDPPSAPAEKTEKKIPEM